MKRIQVQGVHHITLVGSTRSSAIEFWQGLLGMRLLFEQPNLGRPEETHLYFDPWRRLPDHGLHQRNTPG